MSREVSGSHRLDINDAGHFSTVLVGIGDLDTRAITVANAGHLNPLIVVGPESGYAATKVGPPLGVEPIAYSPTTFVLPPGSAFLAFTDGLVERRGESIEVGLERLEHAATASDPSLDGLLSRIVDDLAHEGSEDDVAILAFRWRNAAGAQGSDTGPVRG